MTTRGLAMALITVWIGRTALGMFCFTFNPPRLQGHLDTSVHKL